MEGFKLIFQLIVDVCCESLDEDCFTNLNFVILGYVAQFVAHTRLKYNI